MISIKKIVLKQKDASSTVDFNSDTVDFESDTDLANLEYRIFHGTGIVSVSSGEGVYLEVTLANDRGTIATGNVPLFKLDGSPITLYKNGVNKILPLVNKLFQKYYETYLTDPADPLKIREDFKTYKTTLVQRKRAKKVKGFKRKRQKRIEIREIKKAKASDFRDLLNKEISELKADVDAGKNVGGLSPLEAKAEIKKYAETALLLAKREIYLKSFPKKGKLRVYFDTMANFVTKRIFPISIVGVIVVLSYSEFKKNIGDLSNYHDRKVPVTQPIEKDFIAENSPFIQENKSDKANESSESKKFDLNDFNNLYSKMYESYLQYKTNLENSGYSYDMILTGYVFCRYAHVMSNDDINYFEKNYGIQNLVYCADQLAIFNCQKGIYDDAPQVKNAIRSNSLLKIMNEFRDNKEIIPALMAGRTCFLSLDNNAKNDFVCDNYIPLIDDIIKHYETVSRQKSKTLGTYQQQ